MKATELIKQLQEAVDKYGDLDVNKDHGYESQAAVKCVDIYDTCGYSPTCSGYSGKAAEILLG